MKTFNVQHSTSNDEGKKKRVMFTFDERSRMTSTEFERICREEGWAIVEVATAKGTVRIPIV
jgi:hypothetical protein